ncbi:hypothetical protein SGRA_1407 [Saprospira grandis str. Lewin]|uniref:Uncharacterized protein n=1 Tax=Saprospira grandis (strain Lewin) TaxID=984262 RepID=H6L6K0_SAPGL|nr:hypothetical protein SGRA_1407 [Saprospira grandis str. Lewin]
MDSSGPKGQTQPPLAAQGRADLRAATEPDPKAQRAEGAAPNPPPKTTYYNC